MLYTSNVLLKDVVQVDFGFVFFNIVIKSVFGIVASLVENKKLLKNRLEETTLMNY